VALLDKLEAMGMIERQVLAADKRAAAVSLTDAGRAGATIGRTVLLDVNARGVAGFSDGEAALLVGLLVKLIANLEDTTKN